MGDPNRELTPTVARDPGEEESAIGTGSVERYRG